MQKLPLSIAQKLKQLTAPGSSLPASAIKHEVITKMLEDGLLQQRLSGRTRAAIFLPQPDSLHHYLANHFGINDIDAYIATMEKEETTRAENAIVAANSKHTTVRTFSGFLVNSLQPIETHLQQQPFVIAPQPGSCIFIQHWQQFVPANDVTIAGVENPENFFQLSRQQHLFAGKKILFVSLYPQSSDLINWLLTIPNAYLHFGDMDFAGIGIYLHQFKKVLGSRSSFFVPPQTEKLLQQYGNRTLFNKQYEPHTIYTNAGEPAIVQLLQWLMQYKKVLEQEIFITLNNTAEPS
jgi:hypothetical protein